MDTPDCNKLGTPASKFEDSPVFNYINNLSPIKPVKSVHTTQVFQSFNFSAIPSIFSSPHLNTNKEFKFLQRHPFSEIVRPDDSLDGENKLDSTSNPTEHENLCEPSCSFEVKSSQLPNDAGQSECLAKLPDDFLLDSEDPQFRQSNTDSIEDVALSFLDPGGSFILSPSKDVEECSGEGEVHVEETLRIDRSEDEVTCDWETLIFDSSIENEPTKRAIDKSCEPVNIGGSCDMGDLLSSRNVLDTSEDNIGSVSGDASNDNERMDAAMCVPPSCETALPNLQSSVRRRCLVFETSGAHRKKLIAGYPVGQSGSGVSATDRQIVSVNPTTEPVHRMLPGIGLHLNSLAAASKLKIVKQQSMAVGQDAVGTRISSAISIVPLSGQRVVTTSARTSSDVDKDVHKSGSPDGEETSQASQHVANGELTDSPKKKRQRAEHAGESRVCKHCNCKKSRCLKLYCECFAAGVYCVEPCACQDCFNKPLHEHTVITTRKQIQSRNPLAFAPKVVRGPENAGESGEASSKTPASARHKRGCNCKKSSCLKKYCECYQVGVGCSESCRCEGCKNAFGRKDINGCIESPLLREGGEVAEPSEAGSVRPVSIIKIPEGHNPNHVLPRTPIHMSRVEHQHFSSNGNPPRSSFIRIGSSSGIHISGRFGNPAIQPELKCRAGDEMPAILKGERSPNNMIKVVSPNKKRVSPPHCESESSPSRRPGRRLILQSIPAFPPLTPQH